VFYERVVVIMNRAIFIQLLDGLGAEMLFRLARSGRISCACCNQFTIDPEIEQVAARLGRGESLLVELRRL
jgi:hypothetical protein